MTISIDSNVISALWSKGDPFNADAALILGSLRVHQKLIVTAIVYSELMAGPLRDELSLDHFFVETGIEIDWTMDEEIWRTAGRAYSGYTKRRKASGGTFPRRILTDFLIGAHALVREYSLLTFDKRLYAAAFPKLKIISN